MFGMFIHSVRIQPRRECDCWGSEGSGATVWHLPKAKATRTSHPKQAVRPFQGSNALIEDADLS